MATVLLFHHAQGQTPGFLEFAEALREAGHAVEAPDLYQGRTFATLEEGVAHGQAIGFPEIVRRGAAATAGLPAALVYAGFSLGVLPAQALTQNRPGARGALFYHACIPLAEFGGAWPAGVPLQYHAMEGDAWADVPIAREVAALLPEAALFLYPGAGHLFADFSSSDYDEAAAALLMERTLSFLERVG